jgi:oxygen-dependent protoporphyrinogen oxidase
MPDALIGQSVLRSYGFDGERLFQLEPGEAAALLGFQVPKEELGKGIRSLKRGMGSLVDSLHAGLLGQAVLRENVRVMHVRTSARGPQLHTTDGLLDADLVILATPAAAASTLLDGLVGEPARALFAAPTMSSVTVELAYPRDAVEHPLDGTGFVVALAAQQAGLRACTFTSSKFIDRSPPERISLRLFFRPTDHELATLDDAAWSERAVLGLGRVLRVQGRPLRTWVSRWAHALPVFSDAHRAAVSALERALLPHPVLLAGSAFHGSGIDAAVRSAENAAAAVLARMV